jgi:aspartyl protease family protein
MAPTTVFGVRAQIFRVFDSPCGCDAPIAEKLVSDPNNSNNWPPEGAAAPAARQSRFRGPCWVGEGSLTNAFARRINFVLLLVSAMAMGAAQAQSVALAGMLGSKALLIVDGTTPKSVAAGETHQGVKVISTAGDQAVIEQDGKRRTVRVGDAPVSLGGAGASAGRGTRIMLTESGGGHFMTAGQINGRAVQFMVDTGATNIAMSMQDAERAGIAYKTGQPVRMSTANGVTDAFRIKLNSVRVGDVEVFDVDAVVIPQPMPFLLLGNSFLSRFQMRRENTLMTLDKRY